MESAKGAREARASRIPTPWYRDSLFLCLATAIFVADQISKHFVRTNLAYGQSIPYEGPLRITHVYNSGAAFGLFQDLTLPLIFASLIGIGVLLLVYRNSSNPSLLLRLSLGLQVGGAGGNLLDRVRLGHVTDFFDVGPWPVFNVADASIVVGIFMLAWVLLRGDFGRGNRDTTAIPLDCPFCDWPMVTVPRGRRCNNCGVIERTEVLSTDVDVGKP